MKIRDFQKICKYCSDFAVSMSIANDISDKMSKKLVESSITFRRLGDLFERVNKRKQVKNGVKKA